MPAADTDEVRRTAFSMPLANPTFPRGPARHDIADMTLGLGKTGEMPTSPPKVGERKKDIIHSSRTRMVNGYMRDQQNFRKAIANLLEMAPPERRDEAASRQVARLACDRRNNVQQLICADARFEGGAKDCEFGQATMRRHRQSGADDIAKALARPGWSAMPDEAEPFKVHAIAPDSAGELSNSVLTPAFEPDVFSAPPSLAKP